MTNEEAKEIFDHNWTRLVNPDYSEEELGEAQNLAIEALSVEPQEGEWLPPDEFFDTKIWRKCSKCGINIDLHPKYISFGGEVHYSNRVSNYCPKCGAKMESEDT